MNDRDRMTHRDELECLLPFYVNGTLDGEDLARVEDWLARDPAARAALAEAEAEYAGSAAGNEAIRPPADALTRFSQALERDAGPDRSAVPGLFARLREAVVGVPVHVAWAAAAALLAIVVVQNVIDTGGRPGDFEVAGTGDEASVRPFVLVVFRADATMADISAALEAVGAGIVDGPTPDGVYRVAIDAETDEDYLAVAQRLEAARIAQTIVPGRKPSDVR